MGIFYFLCYPPSFFAQVKPRFAFNLGAKAGPVKKGRREKLDKHRWNGGEGEEW